MPVGQAEEPQRRSGEATASLILGFFSFIPPVGLLTVIFGHLANASIRRSGGRLLGGGMALVGLFLGYLSLGIWLIYAGIIARSMSDACHLMVQLAFAENPPKGAIS